MRAKAKLLDLVVLTVVTDLACCREVRRIVAMADTNSYCAKERLMCKNLSKLFRVRLHKGTVRLVHSIVFPFSPF